LIFIAAACSIPTNRTPPGTHQALNGGIADRPYSEDGIRPSIQENNIRVLVIGADKNEICSMKAEVLRDPQKRLKLSSTGCQGNPLAARRSAKALSVDFSGTSSWNASLYSTATARALGPGKTSACAAASWARPLLSI
jgi:hypothetical protein